MFTPFQDLLLIALGKKECFAVPLTDVEWRRLYDQAKKHSMIGVCFSAIEVLPNEQRPPLDLLMQWVGLTEIIKRQNEIVNEKAKEVTGLFTEGGFKTIVLKGQSIAKLYTPIIAPEMRMCGDIDLWVDGERKRIIDFLKRQGWTVGETVIHHTDVEIFKEVSVEVHHYPSYTFSPVRWMKYKKWFADQAKVQFQQSNNHHDFVSPSIYFDAVYVLLHIFRHVFHEGIGLRQLLDYYFILLHTKVADRQKAMETLRWFGLDEFVAAVMYIEQEFFQIKDEYLLCTPSKNVGCFLLREVLRSGNFGWYDERIKKAHSGGVFRLYLFNVFRLLKMVRFFPEEVLWAPIWKPIHWLWRKWYRF